MNFLWLSWKDIEHPQAGGAEIVASELGKRLAKDGHEVIFVAAHFPGAAKKTEINGYKVIRLNGKLGGRMRIYWDAWRYVRRYLRDWPDLTIEEINTMPFFSRFYMKKPRLLFFHQLCRQTWFYQLPRPIGLVGFLIEPLYIRLLNKDPAIAMSKSTKQDLVRCGFKPNDISIISEGIELEPVKNLDDIKKYKLPTLLSLGALRSMKRTMDQIKAFEIAKQSIPDLQLKIAGDYQGAYGTKVLRYSKSSIYADDIEVLGRVSKTKKIELMQKCHLLMVTSIKEGWGLIVTEANSQGTPAVAYNVDGLRDSIREGETGIIAEQNNPQQLAANMITLLSNDARYAALRKNAWQWSKTITFNQGYQDFIKTLRRVQQ
jgi:glycosyltransferase involved in cell wall biosynthesis